LAAAGEAAVTKAVTHAFAESRDGLWFWTALSNDFFWKGGEYNLSVVVQVARPNKGYVLNRFFSLTDQDVQNLRYNILVLLDEVRQLPAVYNFAYPEYALHSASERK
jgi:hypothetical protein